MKFNKRSLHQIADMICGNFEADKSFFPYRSSSYLSEFFEDCDTPYRHDGSTRKWWVAETLAAILDGPHPGPHVPPDAFVAVIRRLMARDEATNEGSDRPGAISLLNAALQKEGFEAFYAEDGNCYLRHTPTGSVAVAINPQRPLTPKEIERRTVLEGFLDTCSEDELIGDVLLPLFRQLGFQRVTVAGHEDKLLEYGKDLWMKFKLPTLHSLYFGIQVKRGKLDAAGKTKTSTANVAEVLAQIRMMLGHKIFDPETNRRVLVDHAIIIAGGEITKQAKNWLGEQLDISSRSQILFMDRNDLLDLYITNNISLPAKLMENQKPRNIFDEIPF